MHHLRRKGTRVVTGGWSFLTKPVTLAQGLSSASGVLALLVGSSRLGPQQFATFALLVLVSTTALGAARSAVFQPALIHQREAPDAFTRARVAWLLALITGLVSAVLAPPLGVESWEGAAAVGATAVVPIMFDWLRYRCLGNDQRWILVIAEAVRLVLVPTAWLVPALTADAVTLQCYISASAVVPAVGLYLAARRPRSFAPYSAYSRHAALQLGDFAVGQFIIAVPLLVLGSGHDGDLVSGVRLAQALLGTLNLLFAASAANLMADAATRESHSSRAGLISAGAAMSRNLLLTSIVVVLASIALVLGLGIEFKGVSGSSLAFGLALVGFYTMTFSWSGMHAVVVRILGQQALVTVGRLVVAAVTIAGFVIGYVVDDAAGSLIAGFLVAGIASPVVFWPMARWSYRRERG